MKNYINIEGKKIELSDETVANFKDQFGVKSDLPKSWEDYDSAVIDLVLQCNRHTTIGSSPLPPEWAALYKLIQLRDCYNDGWFPDWSNDDEEEYSITFKKDEPGSSNWYQTHQVLSFKNRDLCDEFLENFRDLIEIAKPLL